MAKQAALTRFEIYTTDYCRWCMYAKEFLKQRGHSFTEHRLNTLEDQQELEERAGHKTKTVPQIFVDNKLIGGYTALEEFFAKEENLDKINEIHQHSTD